MKTLVLVLASLFTLTAFADNAQVARTTDVAPAVAPAQVEAGKVVAPKKAKHHHHKKKPAPAPTPAPTPTPAAQAQTPAATAVQE